MYANLDQAENWYVVARDGLRHLGTAVHASKALKLSDHTLDQIQFVGDAEWREFLRDREDEHEMYATLAVLATCEGGIRRDAEWRGAVNVGQAHFLKFQALANQPGHVSIHAIFDTWQSALGANHPFRARINQLRSFYRDRNLLAHGRAHLGQFAFAPIFQKLETARDKWKSYVADFKGF